MRRTDMNKEQLAARETITTKLLAAHWKPTDWHLEFDKGQNSVSEAELTRKTKKMNLCVTYAAPRNSMFLKVEDAGGAGAELEFLCMDKLEELLNAIVSFQNEIDKKNFRRHFTTLVKICPETYVMNGTLRTKLFADDDPERPSLKEPR